MRAEELGVPRVATLTALGVIALTLGPAGGAQQQPAPRPVAPPDGVMGFVVQQAISPVLQGPDACPAGLSPKMREQYLLLQNEAERARLSLPVNEKELTTRWQARVFGPNNATNVCSQPDMFPNRPEMRTVESRRSYGMDVDGGTKDSCAHTEFVSPDGDPGIDNQEYRVMGCTKEWRGTDGIKGDMAVGMQQFHTSGEWTQVILLKGVDSLERDDAVEVVYANTPDRPPIDAKGNFLRGASFSVSDKPPRERNVLKGRIENGVLTTEPTEIKLTMTWGQGGARDIRGNRTRYRYHQGRLRMIFQPDGTLSGLLGGYRPVEDIMQSPMLGGAGSALVAGIDCAQVLQTLRKYADGMKDKKTGKCTAVSGALQIVAIPAWVNDISPTQQAAR